VKLAVIPARGGSKRIPRKNIRSFCGQPLICYSIRAALDSQLFDQVIVSTDDSEIAEVAIRAGASVPFMRPAQLADDHSGTTAVVRHAIEWMNNHGDPVSIACCLYATAPFVTPDTLAQGHALLHSSGSVYAFSVTSFAFPIQRAIRLDSVGRISALQPEHMQTRSQDLEECFHDAGQFYWGRADAFLAELPLFAPHAVAVRLPRHLVQDIDTEEDWTRAELMFEAVQRQKGI
jgi:pseudaminic acid cytidylyltransferase